MQVRLTLLLSVQVPLACQVNFCLSWKPLGSFLAYADVRYFLGRLPKFHRGYFGVWPPCWSGSKGKKVWYLSMQSGKLRTRVTNTKVTTGANLTQAIKMG